MRAPPSPPPRLTPSIRDACFHKCVHRFAEAEIAPGEGACIDRCVVKYMRVLDKVGMRIAPSTGSDRLA